MKFLTAVLIFFTTFAASLCFAGERAIPSYDVAAMESSFGPFNVHVVEDRSNNMGVDEIASGRNQGMQASSRFYLRSAQTTYWFAFTLTNSATDPIERVVYFDEPFAEKVNMYYEQDGAWRVERAGLSVPVPQRRIQNHKPIFSVEILPGESKTIYLEVHSNYGMLTIGLYIDTPPAFLKYEQILTACYFFYFGSICALLLYNVFLFISLRDRLYFYYAMHAFCYTFWVLLYSGFDLYLGVGENLHYRLNSVTNLVLTFLALFTRNLLQTKSNLPKIDKILLAISAAGVLSWLASFVDIGLYKYLTFLALPAYTFFLFTGVYAFYKRIDLSGYYLLSMWLYFTGIILLSLLLTDAIPYNLITRYSYLPGSLAELTIFSIALAARVKLLQNQNNAYQLELLHKEQEAKEVLERTVSERTAELKRANDILDQMAKQDSLTGLANRRSIDERLNDEWARLKREKSPLSVILCDIDYFKRYNDHYGHKEGDECLVKVAQAIQSQVRRSSDLAGRYGGEEFIIILPNTAIEGAASVAEDMRNAVANLAMQHEKSDVENHVTVSFGAASTLPQKDIPPDKLVIQADEALYRAKAKGRNCVCV